MRLQVVARGVAAVDAEVGEQARLALQLVGRSLRKQRASELVNKQ